MINQNSLLDEHREYIELLVQEGKNKQDIANILKARFGINTSRHSIRRALKRWQPKSEKASVRVSGDVAEVTSVASPDLNDPDALIEERGLDPEEWSMDSLTINEWDAPSEEGTRTMKQLKVNLRRKRPFSLPQPARAEGYKPLKSKKPETDSSLVAILGDQHAPHHDPELHELVCAWLTDNKPGRGVLLGDLLDFPEISRHRHDPAWAASTQECIDSGYRLLRDYISASPDTEWKFLAGNHEVRIRNTIIDQARDLYGIKPGSDEDEEMEPALGFTHLLRLDELGIDHKHLTSSYEQGKIVLNRNLGVVHGHKASKGSGVTALKMLEEYHHSIICGHTHRLSSVHQTKYDILGEPETLTAAESGCLCKVKGGLGYTVNPDWQPGFLSVNIHSDTHFKIDLGVYAGSALLWRNERYVK